MCKVRKIKHSCGFEWDDLYKYKGYTTIASYSKEDNVWYGQIVNIRDLVNWESETVEGIEQAFKEAVDDYIEYKKEIENGKDKD